jgi:hypothetical protein
MSVVLLENLTIPSDSQNPRIYFVDNLVTFLHTGYLNPVTTWNKCHHHSSVISPTSFPRGVAVLSVAFGQLSVFLGQAANWVASSLSSGNASALFIYKWHSLLYISISKLALIFETRSSGLGDFTILNPANYVYATSPVIATDYTGWFSAPAQYLRWFLGNMWSWKCIF